MDASEPPDMRKNSRGPAVGVSVEIIRRAPGWESCIPDDLFERAAEAAILETGEGEAAEVSLLLAADVDVRALNRQWRGKDQPTNVLSFPLDAPAPIGTVRHLGDIALAFETVAREADERGIAIGQHAAHLVVHGMLHLLGYDHEHDAEAREMESLEARILGRMGFPAPYDLELSMDGDAR
jgi:probable rRNA maturation factor